MNDTLHHKSVTMEDASTKFEIARAEQVRNQTEHVAQVVTNQEPDGT